MRIRTFLSIAAIPALLLAGPVLAESPHDVLPATTMHGLPGNNPANGGSSANPEDHGNGVNSGNGIHNIAGGAPGQGGVYPQEGQDPANTMHGGLDDFTGRDSPLDDIP